jgi:outer membrane protein OmpA-like peptidoglycan-associated protein
VTEETPIPAPPAAEQDGSTQAPGQELHELRALILGPVQTDLAALERRVQDPKRRADDVAAVLPQAAERLAQDARWSKALVPAVEGSVQISVRKNSKVLVEALFPVIGPAIRKAISESLRRLLQELNLALDRAFSIQGWRWRLEAWTSGKSFAEVVLSHSLLYRVDQVFLIHRDTGLLLQHATAPPTGSAAQGEMQDADLVSGMLRAIQDFVHDSFQVGESGGLESMQVGELTIWAEQGPAAVLVGVLRGTPPESLRDTFQQALAAIHRDLGEELASFRGDAAPFEASRPYLEECLVSQYAERPRRLSAVSVALLGLLAVGLAAAAVWMWRQRLEAAQWAAYVERLEEEPGIVVVETARTGGQYRIVGLRDPAAVDPVELLRTTEIDPALVDARWQPYLALQPRFVLNRAQLVLQPPAMVQLSLEGGTLRARGSAPHAWIEEARSLARAVAGVQRFEAQVTDEDATGRERALAEFQRSRQRIESASLVFDAMESRLPAEQEGALQDLVSELRRLLELARSLGLQVELEIVGHTDSSGNEAINSRLSQQRAERVASALAERGLDPGRLHTSGVGAAQPSGEEASEADRQRNRRVTFLVRVSERPAP